MTPNDRKYTRTHEWVKIEENITIVGITEHAQDALGDITFVELPKVGTEVEKEKECGVIESVKAASDLYFQSPIHIRGQYRVGNHPGSNQQRSLWKRLDL